MRVLFPAISFHFSPLRRALTVLRREWKPVKGPAREPRDDASHVFFQYAYTRAEFEHQLRAARLRVRQVVPYSIVWGRREIPLVAGLIAAASSRRAPNAATSARPSPGPGGEAAPPSVLKRLLIGEDRSIPVAGRAIAAAGWLAANMLMFVCDRDEAPA